MSEPEVEVLALGEWPRGSVETVRDPEGKRKTNPRIESLIAEKWEQSEREAAAGGKMLFAGPLCRLMRYECARDRLRLFLGRTDYREFLGTNMQWPAVRREAADADFANYLANALAVCAAVRTADGKLVVGRRSQRVMEHPGRWHVPGGSVDPQGHVQAGAVDVFGAMLAELREELGCAEERVSLTCLGLIRPLDSLKPELLFLADLQYAWRELLQFPQDMEHDELASLDDEPEAVLDFLRREARTLAPSGKAALWRYGQVRFGADWAARAADRWLRGGG